MVFDGQHDAVILGDLDALFEHLHDGVDLRSVRFVAKHQRRGDDPHDVGAHELSLRDQVRSSRATPLRCVRLPARRDGPTPARAPCFRSSNSALIRREVSGFQALEETRFQRDAIDVQLGRPVDEILKRPTYSRVRLIRIDFAEVAVVAVTVDADFHVQISSIVSPNTLPRN